MKKKNLSYVVVPDYQLSLAIGKAGQNARLAAKLTNWKIDIKSETQAAENPLQVLQVLKQRKVKTNENQIST